MFDVVVYALCVRFECGCEDRFQTLLCSSDIELVSEFLAKDGLACCQDNVLKSFFQKPIQLFLMWNQIFGQYTLHIRARHQHILKITSLLLCGIQCLLMWIVGLQYLLSATVTF